MPPSAKRGRAPRRTPVDAHQHMSDDAEDLDNIATPSRSSRKRARDTTTTSSAGRAATRRKTTKESVQDYDRDDTDGTEAQDQSDADTEPSLPTEADVISKLRVSDKFVHATQDYANDLLAGVENVPGFGKIAGRDWTFIIKQVEINIGRPEQNEKPDSAHSVSEALSHKSNINIDLGPDRQTSRLHATIAYDSAQEQWFIIVNGRNGLRLDSYLLKRGTKACLRSGSVIDIGGTQMAFITTPTQDSQAPIFADAILRQIYSSEDDDADADPAPTRDFTNQSTAQPPLPYNPSQSLLPPGGHSDDHQQPPPSSHLADVQHPHSHTSATQATSFATPGTPVRQQQSAYGLQFPRPSPASNSYLRGVMMESTESIDYAADSAKDLKPPHSYAQLIGMAILSTGEQQMTLNNIYKWIMANYAFYRFNTGGWQNSIRHNLSLNKAFEKIARRTDEPGKGMKWMISPKERDTFLSQGMKGCRRPNGNGSDPSSPTQLGPPFAHYKSSILNSGGETKPSPSLNHSTSFSTAYQTSANEAFTPDRGSTRRPVHSLDDNEPDLSYYPPSAKSTLNHLTAVANAAGSPPALYTKEEGRSGLLDTPFPMRSSQKLMPPSTLQQPSAFMDFSSPAPFWKFGSTPLRPLADMSPVKTPFSTFRPLGADLAGAHSNGDERKHSADSNDQHDETTVLQSSSPPPPLSAKEASEMSPSRTFSRPVTSQGRAATTDPSPLYQVDSVAGSNGSQDAPTLKKEPVNVATPAEDKSTNQAQANGGSVNGQAHVNLNGMSAVAAAAAAAPRSYTQSNQHSHAHTPSISMPRFDPEDEGGIDLMKGFQPIGSFHKLGRPRFGMGLAAPTPTPGAVSR